jgi:hypothetical protein
MPLSEFGHLGVAAPLLAAAVVVALVLLALRSRDTAAALTHAGLGGPVSVILPLPTPTRTALDFVTQLFLAAAQPLRVHAFLAVPPGHGAVVAAYARYQLQAANLHVSATNVHVHETRHAACASDDCARGVLANTIHSGCIVHLRQPAGAATVTRNWASTLEASAQPGCILTVASTRFPCFTAMAPRFHPDTELPHSVVYSARAAMDMPAAVISTVFAAGRADAWLPFDTRLCGAAASSDVVYSARLFAAGRRLVHPQAVPLAYDPVEPRATLEPGAAGGTQEPQATLGPQAADPDLARNRLLCQMGVITLPVTTPEAADLPGDPLTEEQRSAWARHVGADFDAQAVVAAPGVTAACGTLVQFNKTHRL